MDELEVLLSSTIVDEALILSLVDEYQLYGFYLEFAPELRTPYHSPFRKDEKKSWSLFQATKAGTCEFLWKDSGGGITGNIFLLVRILYNLDGKQATFRQIDADFQLGLFPGNQATVCKSQIPHYEKPPPKGPSKIRVKSVEISHGGREFWASYGVGSTLLQDYKVEEVSHFWTQPEQDSPFTPKGLCFSYQIGDRYKIYQPFNPSCKFLNNYEPWMVEGWLQLPPGKLDTLVISKSTKDIACLRAHGVYAVGPRSESTPILPRQLELIKRKADRVLTWFDNDFNKEVNIGQELAKQYPFPSITIPSHYQLKDPSDFRKARGEGEFRQLLNHLLHGS